MSDTESAHRVRNAALDLILGTTRIPSPDEVAEATGLSVEEVQRVMPADETLYAFLFQEAEQALDRRLKVLPYFGSPTLSQQRAILDAALNAVAEMPRETRVSLRLIADPNPVAFPHLNRFSYQLGVRILGADYSDHSELMMRVFLLAELLGMAVLSGRHNLADPHEREVLLDSLLGVLHPPARNGTSTNRRWSDPTPPADANPNDGGAGAVHPAPNSPDPMGTGDPEDPVH